jgi:hypothetical protein
VRYGRNSASSRVGIAGLGMWYFEGSGKSLSIGITANGSGSVNAAGTQECRPTVDDENDARHMRGLEGFVSIHPSTADEVDYDGSGFGLKAHYEKHQKQVGMITWFETDAERPGFIGLSILVPSPVMDRIVMLMRDLMATPNLRYFIAVEFGGFKVEGAESATPTIGEFMDRVFLRRKPYFSQEVTVTVRFPPAPTPAS